MRAGYYKRSGNAQPPLIPADMPTELPMRVEAPLAVVKAAAPTIKLIELTPDAAREYLRDRRTIRPLTKTGTNRFVDIIRDDKWQITHQGLAFNRDGKLFDGQHRCAAVVATQRTVIVFAAFNADEATYTAIDSGKPRTNADHITHAGFEKHQTVLAPALRLINLYDSGLPHADWRRARVYPEDLVACAEANAGIGDLLERAGELAYATCLPKPTALVAIYLSRRECPNGPHEMFERTVRLGGGGEDENSAAAVYKRWLTNWLANRGSRRLLNDEHLAIYIKAFNAYVLGRRVTTLSYKSNEEFPRFINKA